MLRLLFFINQKQYLNLLHLKAINHTESLNFFAIVLYSYLIDKSKLNNNVEVSKYTYIASKVSRFLYTKLCIGYSSHFINSLIEHASI